MAFAASAWNHDKPPENKISAQGSFFFWAEEEMPFYKKRSPQPEWVQICFYCAKSKSQGAPQVFPAEPYHSSQTKTSSFGNFMSKKHINKPVEWHAPENLIKQTKLSLTKHCMYLKSCSWPTLGLSLSTQLHKSITLKSISSQKNRWKDDLLTTAVEGRKAHLRFLHNLRAHWKQIGAANCKLVLNLNSNSLLLLLLRSNGKHWTDNRAEKQFYSTCTVITAEYKIIISQVDYRRVLKHHPGHHQTAASCPVEEH